MRVNVYLPDSYKSKWDVISNKSQLVQEAIDRSIISPNKDGKTAEQHVPKVSETTEFVDTNKQYNFCKHDAVKGMCKYGCK